MALGRSAQVKEWGLPVEAGLQFHTPFPFAGMNQAASRMAVEDKDFWWVENYILIGAGNYQTAPDVGPALYNAAALGKTILFFQAFNINQNQYFCVFHTDGTANQINAMTGAVTPISSVPGTFYLPVGGGNPITTGYYPASVNWGSTYFLISNNNTPNDYWAWDGTLLYTAGSISPQITLTSGGQNYSSAPSTTIFGGLGTGITLAPPQVADGSVIGISIGSPGSGYAPGDVVQVGFSGGGSDTSALAGASLFSTSVQSIAILAQGKGYGAGTTVVITPQNGAVAVPNVVGGQIVSINVTAGGSGFRDRPVITFANTGGGTGAVAVAALAPQGVQVVNIVNGGTNYFGLPTLSFVGGGGSLAAAIPIMSGPGPIVSVSVVQGGAEYITVPSVTITDPTGSGASVLPILTSGVVTGFTIVNPGHGYTNPTVTIAPSTGTGGQTATATAAVGSGSILGVTMTNNGGNYTHAPAVIIQPTNNAAAVTLALMPFGVSGTSIETYQSQVWVQYPNQNTTNFTGGVRLSSAPASISNFAASAGGLLETNTDRFLRTHFTAIRQANGFLYPFAAGAVNVISNVQVGGSPTVKTLNNQNTDPQVGTQWRDTLQDFGRTVLFTNPFGVYGLYGGAVTKLSEKMDSIFGTAAFPLPDHNPTPGAPVTPSAAVANIFAKKHYLVLMSIFDQFTNTFRNAMLAWDEREWTIISQTPTLIFIGTQQIASQITAWGTDGKTLFPLLTNYSTTMKYTLTSKLYGSDKMWLTKQAAFFYIQAENFASGSSAPQFTIAIDTEYASFTNAVTLGVLAPPVGYIAPPNAVVAPTVSPLLGGPTQDIPGQEIGFTITSMSGNHAIYNIALATLDVAPFFG